MYNIKYVPITMRLTFPGYRSVTLQPLWDYKTDWISRGVGSDHCMC